MAPTFRIATDEPKGRVHVLAVDDFGAHVAARLRMLSSAWLLTCDGSQNFDLFTLQSRFIVIAAAHPIPGSCDKLDELCFERGIPWIAVVHEEGGIAIGPLVVPDVGPCYGCYHRRLAQHAVDADITQTLMDFYRLHPSAGPSGFFPPAASLAAGIIADIINQLVAGDCNEAGLFRRFNLLEWRTAVSRVVGIHGCRRCGQRRDERMRTTLALSDWAAQRTGIRS